jgi:mannan polymerase II complex MNN11 subunit
MQFALPPRRSPHPVPFSRSPRMSSYRRKQLKSIAVLAFAILSLIYLLHYLYSSSSTSVAGPVGTSGVVIVTLLDRQRFSESYLKKIIANREDYAKRHGKKALYEIVWKGFLPSRLDLTFTGDRLHQLLRKCVGL